MSKQYLPARHGGCRQPGYPLTSAPLAYAGPSTGPMGGPSEEVADCCQPSADPLLYGDGRLDCTIATVLVVLTTLMVLAGVVATALHYAAGIEFNTDNRGRVVGPVLLGLSPIPMVFIVFFVCRARERVIQQVEQQKMDYAVMAKISYKHNQASLARSSGIYENRTYPFQHT